MTLRILGGLAALAFIAAPALAALPVGGPMRRPSRRRPASPVRRCRSTSPRRSGRGRWCCIFYPAAFTSGCTVEAHDFADATDGFKKLGATVIGVSADPIDVLDKFSVSECRNKFAVASATPQMISDYDVKLATTTRANRTSYVIAPDGKVIFAYSAMDPAGHVEKTMDAVKAWRADHKKRG